MPLGDFFEDIRSYVSGAIMSSVAALEANINELFIAHVGPLRSALPDFEVQFWGKGGMEKKSILVKYEKALWILRKKEIFKKFSHYENADYLIELRNALVHFKPLWDQERERQVNLVEKLREKFKLSPFCDEGADFISMKCMSRGCAAWAVLSCINIVKEFSIVCGVPDSFDNFHHKLQVE